MQSATIIRAFNAYGITPESIAPVQTGYRSQVYIATDQTGKKHNLLLYKSEPSVLGKIRTANRLSDYLSQQGLPARTTTDSRILSLRSGNNVQYACLYNYLPGNTISWEAYTMDHVKLVGKALAIMHSKSNQLPRDDAPLSVDICMNLLARMESYFNDSGVAQAINNKLSVFVNSKIVYWLRREVTPMTSTHDQLLHMDFVRGNILFSPAKDKPDHLQEGKVRISGIIDFEKVSYGNPAHDIARTLAFLLVDCKYKTTAQVRKYFLKSGYQKRGSGTIENLEHIDKLVVFYLLHDFYKFLLHNPYESLKDNEHYIRTRDILLSQKVLRKI